MVGGFGCEFGEFACYEVFDDVSGFGAFGSGSFGVSFFSDDAFFW